jgi:hypothetical protein
MHVCVSICVRTGFRKKKTLVEDKHMPNSILSPFFFQNFGHEIIWLAKGWQKLVGHELV